MAKDSFPTSEIEKITSSSDQASISIVHGGTSYWTWFGRQGDGAQGADIPAACEFVRMVRESDRVTVQFTGTRINGQYPAEWISVASKPMQPPKSEWVGTVIIIALLTAILGMQFRRGGAREPKTAA